MRVADRVTYHVAALAARLSRIYLCIEHVVYVGLATRHPPQKGNEFYLCIVRNVNP